MRKLERVIRNDVRRETGRPGDPGLGPGGEQTSSSVREDHGIGAEKMSAPPPRSFPIMGGEAMRDV